MARKTLPQLTLTQPPSALPANVGDRLNKLLEYIYGLGLSDDALQTSYGVINDILLERQRMADERKARNGISQEVIERPIFVTGLPRSGTTLLHMLIGADPENRMPRLWEVARPSPAPSTGLRIEERRAITAADLADLIRADPSLLQAHPYFDQSADSAAECEHFGVLDFHFVRRTMGYYSRIPAFLNVELIDDDVEFFRSHKRILQHLQYGAPRKRWALKGTEHHVRLEALKAVYPDARIIWIHRDPKRVFPSIMALHCNLAEGMSGKPVDRVALGGEVLEKYAKLLDRALAGALTHHPDVFHMRYADFAADPVGTLRTAYEAFELPFSQQTGAAIRTWLGANSGDRHGRFKYSLESFGLDADRLESRFARYRDAFEIPLERAPVEKMEARA